MKPPYRFVQAGVLVNAIFLVGGCVAYRSGAFDWFAGRSVSPAESNPSQRSSNDDSESAPTLLPGSKVGIQFVEVTLPDGRLVEQAAPMPGVTKVPEAQTTAVPQQATPFLTNMKLTFPGSKSNPVFVPEDIKKAMLPDPPANSQMASPPK
jgi:hypothetical protein